MKYRIGEVAELFDMTKGGVRHYERLGLLVPQRNESGYRVYSRDNITDIKRVRAFQAMGFSLSEAHALAMVDGDEQVLQKLEQKERALRRQIELAARTAEVIKSQRAMLEDARSRAGEWFFEERPQMYRIPVWQERPSALPDASLRARRIRVERSWTAAMPVVSLCDLYHRHGEGYRHEKGSCVMREDALRFELDLDEELVEYYPACLCLCAYAYCPVGGAVVEHVGRGAARAREAGYGIGGGMLGQLLLVIQNGAQRYAFTKITLPVETGEVSASPPHEQVNGYPAFRAASPALPDHE